jgi:hypothetical protein
MTNELTLPNGQLPDYLRGYESETNDSLITGGISLPRISIRGKQFRFRKDDSERALALGVPLRVVILGAAPKKGLSKAFYDSSYHDGADDAPACSSSNGVTPDSWAEKPQSQTCATCPHNVFGSGKDQQGNPTKGKACADTKQLLVIPPDNPDGELWMFRVPPSSLKFLSSYGVNLRRHKIPIEGVVTEIRFVDAEYPRVEFAFASFLESTTAPRFIERARSDEVIDTIELISTGDGQNSAQQTQQPQQQPVRQTHQQVEETEVIWGDEPAQQQPAQQAADSGWGEEQPAQQTQQPTKQPAQQTQQTEQSGSGKAVQAPDGSYFADFHGTVFDESKHAKKSGCVAGSLKQDGSFKAKRNTGSSQPAQQTQKPSQQQPVQPSVFDEQPEQPSQEDNGQDELASILDQWGSGG